MTAYDTPEVLLDPVTEPVAGKGSPSPRRRVFRVARKRRRRPVRRTLVFTHRWISLVLGLVLVVEAVSGAVLLYEPELHHALNGSALDAQGGPATVSMSDAAQTVAAAHPDFAATNVYLAHGVYAVTDFTTSWTVDPATGRILGEVKPDPTWVRWLANLHECGLTCEGEPGYVGFLEKDVPHSTWLGYDGDAPITWGGLILGGLGVMLVFLTLSGLWLWFPRPRRWRSSMSVRWRKGRFARDTDLHKVIGVVALLPLLMWGFTGTGFEMGPVKTVWYAALPGSEHTDHEVVDPGGPPGGPPIGIDAAVAKAASAVPGARVVSVSLPTPDDPSPYDIYLSSPHDPYGRTDYPGNIEVKVRQRTGYTSIAYGFPDQSLAQTVFDDWNYPVHSGFVVNGWWRLIWLAFGLAPLALMITGVSTWLVRWQTARRRRRAKKQRTRTPDAPVAAG